MFIIFLVVGLFILYLIKIKTKTYRNLMVPFFFFWIGSILLSKYFSENLYTISEYVYFNIYIYVLIIMVSFLIFSKPNVEVFGKNNQLLLSENFNRFILLLKLILFFTLLYYLYKYNIAKQYLPLYKMRIIRYEVGVLFNSGFQLLMYNYVISSLVELFGLLSVVSIFTGQKINFSRILSLATLFLYSLIGNGRFGLFNAIIFIIATIFFKKKLYGNSNSLNVTLNLKSFFASITTLILLFLSMVKISSNRIATENNNFFNVLSESFQQAIIYFTGPFRSLNTFYDSLYMYDIKFSYGRAIFSGLDEFIVNFLRNFGMKVTSVNDTISRITNPPILIGPNNEFNAFYTGIFNAYLDFGKLGVYIVSFILGILSALIWNNHIKNRNIYSFSMVIYSTLILISTEYRIELQQFKTFFIMFILFLLSQYYRKRSVNRIGL